MCQPLYNNPLFLTSIGAASSVVSANLITLIDPTMVGLFPPANVLVYGAVQGCMWFVANPLVERPLATIVSEKIARIIGDTDWQRDSRSPSRLITNYIFIFTEIAFSAALTSALGFPITLLAGFYLSVYMTGIVIATVILTAHIAPRPVFNRISRVVC